MIPLFLNCDEKEKFIFHNDDSKDLFELADNKLRILRTMVDGSNALVGSTIIGEGGTTINGSAESIDFDKATSAVIVNTTTQTVKYTLAALAICNALYLRFLLKDNEVLGNVTIELTTDGTSWKQIYSDVPTGNDLYFTIDNSYGCDIHSIRLTTNGTNVESDQTYLKEIQLYPAVCYPYIRYQNPKTYLYIQPIAKAKLLTMTTFDITYTKSGTADILFQIEKGGTFFWWDGSAWEETSNSRFPNIFPSEANTMTDIQTNMATLLDGSEEYEIGIRAIFIVDGNVTPELETIDISGT